MNVTDRRGRNSRGFSRRGFLGGTVAPGLGLSSGRGDGRPLGADLRPGFILVNIDDIRAVLMGCASYPYLETRTWTRMATEGMRFTRAYVTAPLAARRGRALCGSKLVEEISRSEGRNKS